MSTEVAKTNKKDLQTILNSPAVMDRLKDILGKNASTFATSVVQITQSNAMLANAEPNSIIGAAMTAATLNLPLNNSLGFAYIVPYRKSNPDNTTTTVAQFQIGYKGSVQLAMRTNLFKRIHSTDVRQGEIISRDRLTGEMEFEFIDDDAERLKAPVIGYVAYFRLLSGFEATLYMSMAEIQKHGQRFSKTYKKGLWQTDLDSMATKTVLKLLLSKQAPLSIDNNNHISMAIEADQAVFNDAENTEDVSYVDNETVKLDHNLERERMLLDSVITHDDFVYAESNIDDVGLRKELFQKLVDGARTSEDYKLAEELIDDEVILANLQVKKVQALKAVETKQPKTKK